MIALTQTVIPVVSVGDLDDAAFPPGDPGPWIAVFVARVRTSRDNGILCRARVYVALDVAARMFATLPEIGSWNSPVQLQQYGGDNENLVVFADVGLAENTVRLE